MADLLEDKKFISTLTDLAEKNGSTLHQIKEEAQNYLEELRSQHEPFYNGISIQVMNYIISRGYDKSIDSNPAEIKELAKLMRRHSVAFVMTHKTYIDMFVLGLLLVRHGLPLPHIFAGINLDMPGLGKIGRKSGVIFIRRDIKDNEVYKASLKYFISTLVSKKQHFMWAIEGTRSRTGKVVWPKMGILKYILEGEEVSASEVKYVPISIVYDLIPDVTEMTQEGRGKEKKKENLLWFVNYIRKMGDDYGKISLRIGDPIDKQQFGNAIIPDEEENQIDSKPSISNFAFELVHEINNITPVTTISLICTCLLSKFALTKKSMETAVLELMKLVEVRKPDALVDRGIPISASIQSALNLMLKAKLIKQIGDGTKAKYSIIPEQYMNATYYSNMGVHHFYHRSFIGLALLKIRNSKSKDRMVDFWQEIMKLRDLFKFEFFYSVKPKFCDEIEANLEFTTKNWRKLINSDKIIENLIRGQKILVSQVVLSPYIEAYRVVGQALLSDDIENKADTKSLLSSCIFLGEEMHWKGQIQRVESVSKPFLLNGIRYAQNEKLVPTSSDNKKKEIRAWIKYLDELSRGIKKMQRYVLDAKEDTKSLIPIDRNVVPGSKTASITEDILNGESGPHIGAFFDLDRTLINGFSAKQFFQTRLFSGKMSTKEIIAQFSGAMVYAVGNKNFAALAAMGANGVKGVKEKVFIDVGEEVYLKHLSKAIYPESRALVNAHISMGHTVAIVSAATPYQVLPIARDIGIGHIMCTEMELENGKFTGKIVEPACWGEGKAKAGIKLAKDLDLDLAKSYFYTDSHEDMPLMEIVGNPRPINPDNQLSTVAYQNDWPVYRFNDEERPGLLSVVRAGLTVGSIVPAWMIGTLTGLMNQNQKQGVNNMIAMLGDMGTKLAGIHIVTKGEENLKHRPAVILFNHQSNMDMFIMAKLIRKDLAGIAKKELMYTPIGPFLKAGGAIFIDRKNKDKAIAAMQPAVDALKGGTSIAIAPEGTRSYDYKLGKFKKGGFHLAMQAGVSILPIVIKNAHDAMPRGKSFVKSTVVEVVVLSPVSTKGWNKNNLDKNITKVRKMYLRELNQEVMEIG